VRYFVLGDEDSVLGFGLAGVEGRVARDAAEAAEAFSAAIADGGVGIIIIPERVAELIRPLVDRYVFAEEFPLIVEIPDRLGAIAGKPGIRDMANAAIGIRL
jgi:V/A-type H+-transporting ATPase subunit F